MALQRWQMITRTASAAGRDERVARNRAASDSYHRSSGFHLPKLPKAGRLGIVRKLNNNPNLPGNGFGVPGNGFGGGLPSLHGLKGGLFKNHSRMHALPSPSSAGLSGGGARVSPTKLTKPTPFKPVKAIKIPNPPVTKQPKPKTTTSLGPLRSANTTRPNFARNS
jgi:hypothetical protein